MTVDYTKQKNIEKSITKPSRAIYKAASAANVNFICTHCYASGMPVTHKITWPGLVLHMIFAAPFILLADLFDSNSVPMRDRETIYDHHKIFPGWPRTLYGCSNCERIDSMVPIDSEAGKETIYYRDLVKD